MAGLPAVKTMESDDFTLATSAPKRQIGRPAAKSFAARKQNVVFLGPSGGGKTHLAIALAHQAAGAAIMTRFTTAADLILTIAAAQRLGRLTEVRRNIDRAGLLFVDIWRGTGHRPLRTSG